MKSSLITCVGQGTVGIFYRVQRTSTGFWSPSCQTYWDVRKARILWAKRFSSWVFNWEVSIGGSCKRMDPKKSYKIDVNVRLFTFVPLRASWAKIRWFLITQVAPVPVWKVMHTNRESTLECRRGIPQFHHWATVHRDRWYENNLVAEGGRGGGGVCRHTSFIFCLTSFVRRSLYECSSSRL